MLKLLALGLAATILPVISFAQLEGGVSPEDAAAAARLRQKRLIEQQQQANEEAAQDQPPVEMPPPPPPIEPNTDQPPASIGLPATPPPPALVPSAPPAIPAPPQPGAPNVSPAAPPPSARVVSPPTPGARNTTPAVPTVTPAGAGNATAAAGKPAKPSEEIVPFLQFENAPLVQVLDYYSQLIGRVILRSSQLPATQFITLKSASPLTKSEVITALETVLAMNKITVIPIGEKFVKVVIETETAGAGGAFSKATADELPDSGKFVTQVIQLKYALITDVTAVLAVFTKSPQSVISIPSTQTIIIRDYSENVKRCLEIIEKLDQVSPLMVKPQIVPIKYALASDIAQVLGQLTTSGAGTSVGKSGSSRFSGGTGSSMGTGGSMGMGGSMVPGQQNMGQSGMAASATSGRSSFANRLQSIVNRAASGAGEFQILGETKIIADERLNSLLIFATDQDMEMIKDIIEKLDVVLAQVLIEAIIMEVSLGDGKESGVSILSHPQKYDHGKGFGGSNNKQQWINPNNFAAGGSNNIPINITDLAPGFSYFNKFGNNFDVVVQATAQDSRVNILSRPRIQTSHAVEARLFVGETVPYITGSYYGGYSGSPSSQYTQKEVGIELTVLPLINPDGLVVMDISQNIEQIGREYDVQGAGKVPGTTKRMALAKVAVRDRETIVLGGFISTTKSKSKSGVPYLKDVPLLGALFRSAKDSNDRKELMVFLRPTVLPTPEAAAIQATREKDSLPGMKQGEMEIRMDEERDRKRIEGEMRKQMGLPSPDDKKSKKDKKKKAAAEPASDTK